MTSDITEQNFRLSAQPPHLAVYIPTLEGSSCLEGRLSSRWTDLKGQQDCPSYVDGNQQPSWGQREMMNSVANTGCNGPTQQRTRIASAGRIYTISFRTVRPGHVGTRSSPSKRGSVLSARVSMLKEI